MNQEPKNGEASGRLDVFPAALAGLLTLAVFYTLYFARSFFLPVVLALLLNFLLAPAVRALSRLGIPPAFGAMVVLAALLAGAGAVAYSMTGPVSKWVARAPEVARKLEAGIRRIRAPLSDVTRATEQAGELARMDSPAKAPPRVELKEPGLIETALSTAWRVLLQGAILIVLLYFLLASGTLFQKKLTKVMPTPARRRRALEIAQEIERSISRYLVTVAAINTALAAVSTCALWLLGMPNPLLWGVLAGLLNFIPYLGPLAAGIIIFLAAAVSYPVLWEAALPPLAHFAIQSVEGNFLTPWIMGQRFTLNPVVVFLSLTFWTWIWGIPGALLAVPMLAVFKIVCDRIGPLEAIGEFLGK